MGFQKYSDNFLERTLLPLIPRSVTPNMVSWARVASIPFIFYLLWTGSYVAGLALFTIAALSDAIDGAMARTRGQVTETGKVLDALADRGLIALVAIMLLPRYFGWWLVIAIALLEVWNVAMAHRARRRLGYNPGANWAGKVKMTLQCVAFGMLIISLFSSAFAWVSLAYPLFLASLLFTVVQGFVYP